MGVVVGAFVAGGCVVETGVGAVVVAVHLTMSVRGKVGSGDLIITCPTVCAWLYSTHAFMLYHTAAAHINEPAEEHAF